MTDKTATERLREMLDERGVEWRETVNHANCVFTWWESPIFGMVHAMDNEDGETLFMACLNNIDFTPEQAIAATLGGDNKSRWAELFGTPERAARTVAESVGCASVECGECASRSMCDFMEGIAYKDGFEAALLEWLRGDAE